VNIRVGVLVVLAALGAASRVEAEEGMYPLAASGAWIATEHRQSMTAAPDLCLAITSVGEKGIALRADSSGVELRVLDNKWSLPTDVSGNITVKVKDWEKTFSIEENTSSMIIIHFAAEDILELFENMDKAGSMTISVGHEKPFPGSLAGSTTVTNAFRTCAGIPSHSPSGGNNPFQ
jgi:hypothetical protein